MKHLLIILMLVPAFSLKAQELSEHEIPVVIVDVVKAHYPAAEVEWEMENDFYEAEFEIDNVEIEMLIDQNGSLIQTVTEIDEDAFPETGRTYISTNFPRKKVEDYEKHTDANGVITYSVEIDDNDYLFDASGNYLRMKPEKIKDPGKN